MIDIVLVYCRIVNGVHGVLGFCSEIPGVHANHFYLFGKKLL
jgi:hypothetical protein